MFVTGAQIRAARALAGLTAEQLARLAGLHANSVAYWEHAESIPAHRFREPHACRLMREALASRGIEAFSHPAPGVRFVTRQQ